MDEAEPQNEVEAKSVPPAMGANAVPPAVSQYPRSAQSNPANANDDPLRFVIPMNPSAWAVISGYVGMFSVLAIPAPFAVLFGVLALRDIKRNPSKTGVGRAWFGIAVGALFTIIYAIVLLKVLTEQAPRG